MGKWSRLLIVDDDPDILLTLKLVLKKWFTAIETASQPHFLSDVLAQHHFDLVLLDMNFTTGFTSGKEGLRWLKKIRKLRPEVPIILMTAYGDIGLAVKAMKEGAQDFVVKPWDNEELTEKIQQVLSNPLPTQSLTHFHASLPPQIIGDSQALKNVLVAVEKLAKTDANVLILGENGTGKELIAQQIHQTSHRAHGPFIQVDLGAISESLFESEMFGHKKGSFTDARQDRTGKFSAAQGGTLFLDEIGNLSAAMQAKLLTVLQTRKVCPVGSNEEISLDIRLICATNLDLANQVAQQAFRQDLYYRINTLVLTLPPLRDRAEDIPLLVRHFLQKYGTQYGKAPLQLSAPDWEELAAYAWPGNIRELQHAVERAVIMESVKSLLPASTSEVELPPENPEIGWIEQAIKRHGGNISQAALELGWSRATLYKKMEKYGLGNQ